jgi:hypothetical protein
MLIIGCDYHPSVQQIAFVDSYVSPYFHFLVPANGLHLPRRHRGGVPALKPNLNRRPHVET